MTERDLIEQLKADPSDENLLVYADWLDTHARPEQAAWLRGLLAARDAWERLGELRESLDPDWVAEIDHPIAQDGYVQVIRQAIGEDSGDVDTEVLFLPLDRLSPSLLSALRAIDGSDLRFYEDEHLIDVPEDLMPHLVVLQGAFSLFASLRPAALTREQQRWLASASSIPDLPLTLDQIPMRALRITEIITFVDILSDERYRGGLDEEVAYESDDDDYGDDDSDDDSDEA